MNTWLRNDTSYKQHILGIWAGRCRRIFLTIVVRSSGTRERKRIYVNLRDWCVPKSETVSNRSASSAAPCRSFRIIANEEKKKKNKWGMFHDIRALLLMIFLATRVCVCKVQCICTCDVKLYCVCLRWCALMCDECERKTRTLLHGLVKSRARINYR